MDDSKDRAFLITCGLSNEALFADLMKREIFKKVDWEYSLILARGLFWWEMLMQLTI